MGVAFPLSEVISTYIPPSFYESFYLYLYIGSMVFLLFMYATLLWGRPNPKTIYTTSVNQNKKSPRRNSSCSSNSGNESDRESETGSSGNNRRLNVTISPPPRRPSLLPVSGSGQQHYGSFYLRMGA
uniref:Uncharacterized protein n=2 Tax=Phlebotomus papatasi TaxID=29031 RepID=A0A1B0DKP8_PHLPP